MSAPTETATACEGVLLGSPPWARRHCPGCTALATLQAENAELRDALARRDAEREDYAAYLLDRADQYETKDWRWNPLAKAAHEIMEGALDAALTHGELQEPELRRRVRNWRKR